MFPRIGVCIGLTAVVLLSSLRCTRSQAVGITWNGQTVKNNSLVSLSAVQPRVNATTSAAQAPLLCQGITGGQWYDPSGVLFRLATTDPVTLGGYGQRNVSGGVALYRGGPAVFPHGVQCCTNTTITLCVGMYSDLTLAQSASVSLPTSNGYSYALSVAATYGPNITGGVQFQLLTPTNVDPPVFQLTCTSTSSPPTDVLWTTNGSPVSNTSSQIVTDRPTSTYNNTLTVTGRAYGMYTCTVTTTCSPVCGGPGFTLNPRSTTSSLTVPAPPGPPTGVTAVQSGPTSVSVSWTAPISGGPVTRYDIYYVANGGPSTSGGSTTSTSYVLTNLQVGAQYNISVIAVGIYFGSQNASSVVVVPAIGQLTISGSVTTPTAGSPYTLMCTVPVIGWNGILTIQLTAPNGSMLISNVSSVSPGMNYTLQWPFSPLHTSDGGLYSCVVSSPGLTSVMTSSVINVTIPSPRAVITSTSTLPAHLGDNVNLTCAIQLDPSVDIPVTVVITWFGPGGSLQDDVDTMISPMEYQSTLMLTSLKAEQAGNYTCSTKVNGTYVVPLTLNSTTQVSIHVISITSLSTPLVAGQSYTLYCNGTVLGNLSLTPMVMWSNSNGVVTNGNDITVSNGILKFNPLHTSHGGQYTCQTALSSPVTSVITSVINVTVQIPPPTVTITSTPITTSYYAGTPLSLTCTVQLIPQVDTNVIFNSLWTGLGGQISSGVGRVSLSSGVNQTTVQFYPLNTTDTGMYNCSVSVSASGQQYVDTSIAVSSSITSITVKALPAPQVTITPSGSSTAGSPYNLTCTVMVVNELVVVPQVMWFKNGVNVAVGNSISFASGVVSANTTTLTLQFNPLYTSNGGQYSCIANVSLPVISITSLYSTLVSSLAVQIPPPTVTITAAPSQVTTIGGNITLTCDIQLDPSVDSNVTVNSTWIGPNSLTSSSILASPYQSTLMLGSLTTTGAGNYACSVLVSPDKNTFINQTTQRTTILVSVHAINITTSGSPVAGQVYSLICKGTPAGNTSLIPVVTWRNSTGVVTNGSGITVSNGVLTFNPLHTSHGGQYTCQSTLSAFNSTITSSTQLLNVQIPPPIITTTAVPGQVAITGSNITLVCNVQLDPSVDSTVMVTSTWTAPGGATLSGSNPLWIGSSNQSTLMLTSLGTGNAGSYVCGVSVTPINTQYITGPMGSNAAILVSVHSISLNTSGSPVAGQVYSLICNGTLAGNTSLIPVVTWRNSTGVVTNGSGITVSNGVLTFNPLRTSHGGQYTCQSLVNSLNISTTAINRSITVQIPPPLLTVSAISNQVVAAGSNLTLVCNVQLDPSVDSTVMVTSTWTAPGGATLSGSNPLWIGSSNQSTLMLTSLGTGNAGSYVCGVSVAPINTQYITGPMGSNASILVSVHSASITISGSPVAGQIFSLNCGTSLFGNTSLIPVVTWRNSTGVVTNGSGITVSNGVLTFNPLRTSHGGQYTCQSVVTSLSISTASAITNVIVQIPTPAVSIIAAIPSPVVPIGSNVTLTCNITLDPSVDNAAMVNTTWIGPGGRIYNGTAPTKNGFSYQSILTLVSLKTTDVGAYNCSVPVTPANPQYIISATGGAIIQVLAQLVTITATGSPSAGQTYTLMCVGSLVGNTSITPVVSWKNSNGVITNGGGIIVSGGNLTFNPIRTSHGGQYICQSTLDPPLNSTALASMNIVVQVPPPTVTLTSTPITTSYYAGTPLNLTCTVQLIPQVDTNVIFNSLWTGPGGQISSGVGRVSLSSGVNQTTVQFYPLNTTDTGVYNCSVNISASGQQYVDTSIAVSSSITSITVKALPAPQVTITPSGSSTAGSPYNLTCTVMVVNGLVVVPQVMWFKNGTSITGGNGMISGNTTTLTLQFNPLRTSNGGQYSCIANVSLPVISITSLSNTSASSVIVQIPQPIINITAVALSQVIAIGSNITLTCNIQLDPSVDSNVTVNRTWTGPAGTSLGGSAPNKNGSIYQTTLSLISLKTTDVGIYTCSMTVSAVVPQFIVQTTVSGTIQVSAQAVNITASGSPVAGQMYTLTCTGALVGNASIVSTTMWRNAVGGVPTGNDITVSGGTLTFNPLRTSHGGQYTCLSTLTYPFNSTATNMTNVMVQIPPPTVTITSTPITTSYYAGTPLNLPCTVQLIPQVDTNVIFNPLWTGPGGQISSGVGRVSLSSGVNQTTVQFYPLNTTDTGVYNCSVSVSASGQQYVDTSIAVSSSITSITVTALPAPQVTITPSGSSTAGSPYNLTCTVMVVNGLVVVPQVMWFKNGVNVAVGNSISFASGVVSANTTTLTLQFNPLYTSNGGQYSCIANVSLPVISITSLYTRSYSNVTIQVPPPTVTITSTPITTSYYAGTPLNLTCTVQLIPQVDTNVIFNSLWTGPGGQISSGVGRVSLSSGVNQTTVQIYPLNTTDTGVYNCSVSVSASGQQYVDTSIAVSSSITSITVTALPAPQVTITPSGSSTAGSPYNLTCTVMVVNGLVVVPQVMWFQNGVNVAVGNSISFASGVVSANTTTLTLQFNPLYTSNGGQYSCIANVSLPVISITSLYTTSLYITTVQIPPPTITPTASPSQTISEGNDMVLTCGSQLNAYVDTPVVEPEGVGTYNCSVSVLPSTQYVSEILSYSTIEVALHTITVTASTNTPTSGMNYTITCTAVRSANVPSAPQLSWNKMMGQNVFPGTQSTVGNTTTLSVSFVPLYTMDAGNYTCQSNLSYPVPSIMTKDQNAIVQIPSPRVTITTPNPVVLVGGSINLTCNVTLDPSVNSTVMVTSTWTAPGGATLNGSNPLWIGSSNQSTLMLTSLGTRDAGSYTCSPIILPLNNPFLLQTSGTSSIIVSVHTIDISTSGSPVAGQMYTLTCTGRIVGDTSLTPVVAWNNSNGAVTNGNDITVSNGVLTFNPLHTSHGEQYTCQSTLSSPISSTTATMNITVQIPPPTVTITSTPITTSYYAGTPLNLTCTVQLIPQVDTNVTVTPEWFSDGSSNITIDNYTTISPMIGSSSYVTTLIFNPLGTNDSGWYNCNVSVQPGTPYVISGVGGGSLFLQVLALPAPNVTITPSLPSPSLGVAYSLTCQAMGVAGLVLPIALTWTRADGTPSQSLGSNGTLLLTPLNMSDLTLYTCTAVISLPYKGIYSVGSAAADVAVRTPGLVSGPALATPSDSSSVISWSPPQLSNGRLTGYALSIVQLLDYGMPVNGSAINTTVDVIMTSYNWSRLYSGVPYQTCISAVNPLGPGDPWCKVFFTKEEVPSVAPMGVVVTRSSDGLSMNISWSPLTLSQARGFVNYIISYGPPVGLKRQTLSMPRTVNGSFATVSGLEATGTYSVTVSGQTSAGQGPSSSPVLSVSPVSIPPPTGAIAAGSVVGVLIVAIVIVVAVVAVHLVRSRKQGKLTMKSKTRDLFSPVEVISNGHRNSTIETTGYMEMKVKQEEEVPPPSEVVETNPDDVTEKESAIATEVGDRTRPISITSFRDHVQTMHMERNKGFEQEYKSLKQQSEGSRDIAKMPCNASKNRFANIYPYDDGRVKLKEIPGVAGSDYINASYINGYKYENCYIAAQGPTENTLATFWRMIWENRVQNIVMLTKCIEGGKKKCEQYFSELPGGTFETDAMMVTTLSVVPYADFEIKKLTVKNKAEPDSEPLKITHYHYTSWPDHGVPQFATSILSFVRKVQKAHDKSKGVPLLVHCSAGVGRTGTFIALDAMTERLRAEDSLNIYSYLQDMRRRRTLMVQTEDQYVFLHDALDEYITCGETDVAVSNLRARMNKLRKHIPEKGITGFMEQFQLLEQVSSRATEDNCTVGLEFYNKNKNRYLNKLPYNSKQIFLKTTGAQGSEYINASYVDGYKQLNAYIATQGPLQNTVEDFWRMVWEFKCRVIVMLCPLTENGSESSYCYWPTKEGECVSYGKLMVTLQSTVSYDVFQMRKFNVREEKASI
ncbi:hypothetical protein EMCRGX_G018913 [Ephydatia muelleri]